MDVEDVTTMTRLNEFSSKGAIGAGSTCRCCLVSDASVVSIFTVDSECAEQLQECAGVEVWMDDGLPTGLCPECLEDLLKAHEFKTRCLRIDHLLKSVQNDVKIKAEPKPIEEADPPTRSKLRIRKKTITLRCNKCNFITDDRAKFNHHTVQHSREKPHNCTVCNRSFKLLKNLNQHLKEHRIQMDPDQEIVAGPNNKCNGCGKTYSNKGNLKKHLTMHEPCKEFYSTVLAPPSAHRPWKLPPQIQQQNSSSIFKCLKCGIVLSTKKSAARHSMQHTNVRCKVCDKRFMNAEMLRRHLASPNVHAELQCPECWYTSIRRDRMRYHINYHHLNFK